MKAVVRKTARVQRRPAPRSNERRLVTKHPRRQVLSLAAGAAALPAVSRISWAQAYPTRPITMVVPVPAGGQQDALSRVLAERMRNLLGQPVIIENITGADGSIGSGRVARARPDGYTIELGSSSTHMLNGALYSLPYDVLKDFAPISPLASLPYILFAKKVTPAKDLNELIAWLKAHPNQASAGVAAASHRLNSAFFQKETGTQYTVVPYRGIVPARQDLVAGQIDLLFGPPDLLPLVRAGSIKAYAVTSDTRLALAPDLPTFGEMGWPMVSYSSWYALFAPRGMPKEIIDRLNAATIQALADPALRSRLFDLGVEIFPRERQTPGVLGALVKADAEKWWPIIKQLGIKPGGP
jgi:tripartite-type tricarboxylate transporter receptor subunit TctC